MHNDQVPFLLLLLLLHGFPPSDFLFSSTTYSHTRGFLRSKRKHCLQYPTLPSVLFCTHAVRRAHVSRILLQSRNVPLLYSPPSFRINENIKGLGKRRDMGEALDLFCCIPFAFPRYVSFCHRKTPGKFIGNKKPRHVIFKFRDELEYLRKSCC